MHECTHCQAELAANAQFCVRCGTPVEDSQAHSDALETTDIPAEGTLETTSRQPAVVAPAAPELSTLRTRRMHPKSPIPPFPSDPWLPPGSVAVEDEASSIEAAQDEQAESAPEPVQFVAQPGESVTAVSQGQGNSDEPEQAEENSPPQSTEAGQHTELAGESQPEVEALDPPSLPLTEVAEIAAAPDADGSALGTASPALAEVADLSTIVAPLAPIPETPALAEVADLPTIVVPLAPVPETPAPAEIADQPTSVAALSPTPATSASEEIADMPTGAVPLVLTSEISAPEKAVDLPADSEKATAPSSLPVSERKSTPHPVTPLPPSQAQPPVFPAQKSKRTGKSRAVLVVVIIVVIVLLGGGAGAFVLLRQPGSSGAVSQCNSQQSNCTTTPLVSVNSKPSSLTFSGAVAGSMTIVAKPVCQSSSSGNLRTLTVNLSGTLKDQLYNFSFGIERYNGPGNYSNATTTLLVLFHVPGESITNGWDNSDPADIGTITVERGEQTGSISYTLGGLGTHAKTQLQITGTWTCDK